ncbi:hypothetical protein KIH86_08410, partial [Paenibacillus sp. HN-1]|uniref:hypothetical protein n=1 Tax=Paenibacillus sinensis TaxID=2834413 RepID=UPI001CA8A7B8
MQRTLPPLLGRVDKSEALRVTGKAAEDRSPLKGATMLVWAGLARATEAVETIIEEAMAIP